MKHVECIFMALALVACVPRVASAPPPAPPPPRAVPYAVRPAPVAPAPPAGPVDDAQRGYATFYGARLAGHKTASGERFNPNGMTAAHRTLPFGTWVEVRRTGTDRVVRVRINDRGPFGTSDRIIDLARAAFARLGSLREGVIAVEVRVVGP